MHKTWLNQSWEKKRCIPVIINLRCFVQLDPQKPFSLSAVSWITASHKSLKYVVNSVACAPFSTTGFPSTQISFSIFR